MANTLGVSFSPLDQGKASGQDQPVNPVQEAIKLLSFRMPTVVGAGAPSPLALMGGPNGGGTQLGMSAADQWIRRFLMGQMGQQPGSASVGPGQAPAGPAPNPNFTLGAPGESRTLMPDPALPTLRPPPSTPPSIGMPRPPAPPSGPPIIQPPPPIYRAPPPIANPTTNPPSQPPNLNTPNPYGDWLRNERGFGREPV